MKHYLEKYDNIFYLVYLYTALTKPYPAGQLLSYYKVRVVGPLKHLLQLQGVRDVFKS